MGYVYAFMVALVYSTTGLFSKVANTIVNPIFITHGRFVFGAIFMILLLLLLKRKVRVHVFYMPILVGAFCKVLNFLTENYGVSMGYSYGNIIIWPMQTIFTLMFSFFVFHERATLKQLLGVLLCVLGVFVIAWNGAPLTVLFGKNIGATLLFVSSGFFTAAFTFFQKKLIGKFNEIEMNLSFFTVSAAIMLIPSALWGGTTGEFSFIGLLALIGLGFTACAGNVLVVYSIKRIPMFLFSVIQSSSVILSLVWASFLYGEPVSGYIILGTVVFLTGMILCISPNQVPDVPPGKFHPAAAEVYTTAAEDQ